jgi:DNA-binding transcriptional MerR regulator
MKIGEFSKKTGLSIHTIHYYEKIGLIKKKSKDISGHRIYTKFDIEWVYFISCLKATGMTLKQIRHFILLREKGESTIPERLSIMRSHKKILEQKIALLNEYLSHINYKIKNFDKIFK